MLDWRQFLLSAALPWPFPSQIELLKTLQRFRAVDTAGTGLITHQQYTQVYYAHAHFTEHHCNGHIKQHRSDVHTVVYIIFIMKIWFHKLIVFQLHATSTIKLQLQQTSNILLCYISVSISLSSVLFYDQVELWFPSGRDVPVPDDPTEPLPYDRLANLKKVMQHDHNTICIDVPLKLLETY